MAMGLSKSDFYNWHLKGTTHDWECKHGSGFVNAQQIEFTFHYGRQNLTRKEITVYPLT